MDIICILLTVYYVILLARVISSFFPVPPSGPIRTVVSWIYWVTEPVLRPIRGLLPPLRMGMVGLDLSPIIVFIAIVILQRAIC